MAVINGTAYWTHIAEPNTKGKYASDKYEIVVGNLDDKAINKLSDLGFKDKIKFSDDKNPNQVPSIKLKNSRRPNFMDKTKTPYPVDTLLGNGSIVKVQVNPFTNDFGTFLGLEQIMVMEMVSYNQIKDEFEEVEEDDDDPFSIQE